MSIFADLADKWNAARNEVNSQLEAEQTPKEKFRKIMGIVLKILYGLRKVVLAAPVVYYAMRLADYNMTNLPDQVGVNLQSSGVFADTISRELAVYGPLGVTAACLVLMFTSRKALYPWAISVFTLALPLLLLFSNLYPA